MRLELLLLGLILALMVLAMAMHMAYLRRIYARVRETTDGDFKMKELCHHLQLPQGSNFNTVMLASWMLVFVALAYLFFQTPTVFSRWNYFRLAQIASSWYGLIVFGWGMMLVTGVVAFIIPKVYGYYIIHRQIKTTMVFAVPLLLLASIIISIYLGTIYPRTDELAWSMGYLTLLAPLVLLLSPVFMSIVEGRR